MTIEQHYVPQFYLNNFALPSDNTKKKKKKKKKDKPQLFCYCISQNKKYTTTSDTFFFEDYLYEYDVKNNTNEMELRFKNNIEDPFCEIIRRIIEKCNNINNNEAILDSFEVEKIIKYIIIQYFRLPIMLQMDKAIKQIMYSAFETEFSDNIYKALWLYCITDFDSKLIKTGYEKTLQTHDIAIIKLEKDFFFTSAIPISFEYKGKIDVANNKMDDIFTYSNIIFPITPKLAVILVRKCESNIKHGYLYIGDDIINTEALLINSALLSDIIVMPYIDESKIEIIKDAIKTYKPQYDETISSLMGYGG